MAEKKPLKKDLKEVIKEISKAPGGNVAMPRPVTPGGIQGGPPTISSPVPGAIQKEPEGPLVKRDIARETFRSFKTGEQVTSNIPEPIDTKEVKVTKTKPTGKKGFKGTQEQVDVVKGVRGGTIGGMTRAPGSKPRLDLTQSIIQMAIERVRRQNELQAIQESLRDSLIVERGGKTITYTSDPNAPKAGMVSRDEQKMIDRAAQAARDALLNRDAATREAVMMRDMGTGEVNPLAQSVTQSEADRRALEGMKALERNVVKVSGGNKGKGTPLGDAKDIQMRKIANAAIVELVDIETQTKIKSATPGAVGKSSSETSLLQLGPAGDNLSGKTVMLARNGKLSGQPLRAETIAQITQAAQSGAKFVVGDMPGVDSEFIKLLDKLNAPYKIYHTGDKPRIQKTVSAPTLPTFGGKGTAAFGVLGLGVDAVLLWKQLLQEASAINQQLQSQRMN